MSRTKSEHLRVRLAPGQREGLERMLQHRDRGENLSDLVRCLIAEALRIDSTSVTLTREAVDAARKLAAEADRSVGMVVEDCIIGLVELLESERPPLLLEEIRLRRKYRESARSQAGRLPAPVVREGSVAAQ